MSETERVRADCLADMFEEQGVSATREQIEAITKDFVYHMNMEREMDSYAHAGPMSCDKCKSKDAQIKELETEIYKFKKGLQRHKHADAVWLEGDAIIYRHENSGREYEMV